MAGHTPPLPHAYAPAPVLAQALALLLQQVDAGYYASADSVRGCPFARHARELLRDDGTPARQGPQPSAAYALQVAHLALAHQSEFLHGLAYCTSASLAPGVEASIQATMKEAERAADVCAAALSCAAPKHNAGALLLQGMESLAALHGAGMVCISPTHDAQFQQAMTQMLAAVHDLAATLQ